MQVDIDIALLAQGSSLVIDGNLRSVADACPVVLELAEAHFELIHSLVAHSQPTPSHSDIALVSVACHAWNLYAEVLGSGLRGRFDVAMHLFRALTDAAGVAFGVGKDDADADRFLRGEEYKAAQGRVAMLEFVRSVNPALADQRESDWMLRAKLLNDASHISSRHVDKVMTSEGSSFRPTVGGRVSDQEMRALVWVAANGEVELLVSIWGVRNARLEHTWPQRLGDIHARLRAWWQAGAADE